MQRLPGWEGAALSEPPCRASLVPGFQKSGTRPQVRVTSRLARGQIPGAATSGRTSAQRPRFRNRGAVKQHVALGWDTARLRLRSALVCLGGGVLSKKSNELRIRCYVTEPPNMWWQNLSALRDASNVSFL